MVKYWAKLIMFNLSSLKIFGKGAQTDGNI